MLLPAAQRGNAPAREARKRATPLANTRPSGARTSQIPPQRAPPRDAGAAARHEFGIGGSKSGRWRLYLVMALSVPALSSPPAHRIQAARRLASAQGGPIGRDQLRALGVPTRTIDAWRTRGLLRDEARRVYAFDATPLSFTGRVRAAMLSAPSVAALARDTAAALTDLDDPTDGPIHLITTCRPPRKQPGIVVTRTRVLDAVDLTVDRDGLICTAPARTMLDLAACRTAAHLDRVLDRAIQRGLYSPYAVERVLSRPQLPGHLQLKSAVARLDENCGRSRSELERRLMRLISESNLPPAVNNAIVFGEELDVHFTGTCVAIEADGRQWHTSPAQVARDAEKQAKLETLGVVVLRFDWAAVNHAPRPTLAQIEATLRRHAPHVMR